MLPAPAHADSGVDVSHWQGCITVSRAEAAHANGVNFAFVKATEGVGFADSSTVCSMSGLKNAGIRRGVYHFARPDKGNSPETEADWFIAKTKAYAGSGVIPVLDWEPGGAWNRRTDWALRWLQRVEKAWGVKPMIYMSASTLRGADWAQVANADYGLWLAGYPRGSRAETLRNPGSVPYNVAPWKFAAAWQYSETGSVPGIGTQIDVNWFYGDAATWARYANATPGTQTNPLPSTPAETPQQGAPTGDVDTLARAVMRGDYGDVPQRRVLLGNRYAEVQARVNQLAAQAARPAQSARTVRVTVRRGDTMSAIMRRTGLYPLSAWTVPSGNPNRIYPGQTVTYHGAESRKTTAVHSNRHIVRRGESLWSIYGTGWRAAAQRNDIKAPYVIHPGQILR